MLNARIMQIGSNLEDTYKRIIAERVKKDITFKEDGSQGQIRMLHGRRIAVTVRYECNWNININKRWRTRSDMNVNCTEYGR